MHARRAQSLSVCPSLELATGSSQQCCRAVWMAARSTFVVWARQEEDAEEEKGGEEFDKDKKLPSLAQQPILLLDGGVSSYLANVLSTRDNAVFTPRELWSSSLLQTAKGRQDIADCHKAFAQAGAQILSTVTYQCHYGTYRRIHQNDNDNDDDVTRGSIMNKRHRVVQDDAEMDQMIENGIRLALQQRQDQRQQESSSCSSSCPAAAVVVAISLGCYGAALADGSEYRGRYGVPLECLQDFHARKVQQVLSNIASDTAAIVLAFETVPCPEECRAIIHVLSSSSSLTKMRKGKKKGDNGDDLLNETTTNDDDDDSCSDNASNPSSTMGCGVWLTLACRNGQDLNDGSAVEVALDIIHELDPHGELVHAIGFNCCAIQHGKHNNNK